MSGCRLISSGSRFEDIAGYSRVVVDGEWVMVSGWTVFVYATGAFADDVVEHTHEPVRIVEAALAEAGAGLGDVVRVRVFLAARDDFELVALTTAPGAPRAARE